MGIMHELYFARQGATETLYHNFPPFGMGKFRTNFSRACEISGLMAQCIGQTKFTVDEGDGPVLRDALVPDRTGGSTMYERMRGTS